MTGDNKKRDGHEVWKIESERLCVLCVRMCYVRESWESVRSRVGRKGRGGEDQSKANTARTWQPTRACGSCARGSRGSNCRVLAPRRTPSLRSRPTHWLPQPKHSRPPNRAPFALKLILFPSLFFFFRFFLFLIFSFPFSFSPSRKEVGSKTWFQTWLKFWTCEKLILKKKRGWFKKKIILKKGVGPACGCERACGRGGHSSTSAEEARSTAAAPVRAWGNKDSKLKGHKCDKQNEQKLRI